MHACSCLFHYRSLSASATHKHDSQQYNSTLSESTMKFFVRTLNSIYTKLHTRISYTLYCTLDLTKYTIPLYAKLHTQSNIQNNTHTRIPYTKYCTLDSTTYTVLLYTILHTQSNIHNTICADCTRNTAHQIQQCTKYRTHNPIYTLPFKP